MLTKVQVVACTISGKRNSVVHILEHMTGVQNALQGPSLAFLKRKHKDTSFVDCTKYCILTFVFISPSLHDLVVILKERSIATKKGKFSFTATKVPFYHDVFTSRYCHVKSGAVYVQSA